jgi:hypothetical protein
MDINLYKGDCFVYFASTLTALVCLYVKVHEATNQQAHSDTYDGVLRERRTSHLTALNPLLRMNRAATVRELCHITYLGMCLG